MSSQIYLEKLEWTLNTNRLKFNGRLAQIHLNLIGQAIVAFVRRKLAKYRELQKLQSVQTHKTQRQKVSWYTGQCVDHGSIPSIGTSLRVVFNAGCGGDMHHVVVSCFYLLAFHLNRVPQ